MQKACLCHWQGKVQPLRNAPRAEGEGGSFVITTEKQRERVGISYTVTQQQLKKKKLNQIK